MSLELDVREIRNVYVDVDIAFDRMYEEAFRNLARKVYSSCVDYFKQLGDFEDVLEINNPDKMEYDDMILPGLFNSSKKNEAICLYTILRCNSSLSYSSNYEKRLARIKKYQTINNCYYKEFNTILSKLNEEKQKETKRIMDELGKLEKGRIEFLKLCDDIIEECKENIIRNDLNTIEAYSYVKEELDKLFSQTDCYTDSQKEDVCKEYLSPFARIKDWEEKIKNFDKKTCKETSDTTEKRIIPDSYRNKFFEFYDTEDDRTHYSVYSPKKTSFHIKPKSEFDFETKEEKEKYYEYLLEQYNELYESLYSKKGTMKIMKHPK